jgi:integrase
MEVIMGVRVREKTPATGVYWLFMNHKGKRTFRQVGSQKPALKAKEIIEAKLKLGESYLAEEKALTPTLEKYYERFKSIYLDTAAVRFTTRRGYESTLRNYLLPAFESKRLDEIDRESLQEFIASLVQKNLAKDTIRLIVANLGTVLNHAKEAKVLEENPAARLAKLFREAHKPHEEISPLTREDVPLFLEATLKHSPA